MTEPTDLLAEAIEAAIWRSYAGAKITAAGLVRVDPRRVASVAAHVARTLDQPAPAATPATDHHYLSTGCLHGEHVLPDGRTGHQYCQGDTGKAGTKTPAQCKFCTAPCVCPCHQEQP